MLAVHECVLPSPAVGRVIARTAVDVVIASGAKDSVVCVAGADLGGHAGVGVVQGDRVSTPVRAHVDVGSVPARFLSGANAGIVAVGRRDCDNVIRATDDDLDNASARRREVDDVRAIASIDEEVASGIGHSDGIVPLPGQNRRRVHLCDINVVGAAASVDVQRRAAIVQFDAVAAGSSRDARVIADGSSVHRICAWAGVKRSPCSLVHVDRVVAISSVHERVVALADCDRICIVAAVHNQKAGVAGHVDCVGAIAAGINDVGHGRPDGHSVVARSNVCICKHFRAVKHDGVPTFACRRVRAECGITNAHVIRIVA
mmetsp:Transcript_16018/g.41447  ORF Transcript_16018/g.41447 Transcript_16018/m.41447 type:complete len:316 (+) Transcript_16018:716-1663(+)